MFFETILMVDARPQAVGEHEARMQRTAAAHGFQPPPLPDLARLVPADLASGRTRCRVDYAEQITSVRFARHRPRQLSALELVPADHLDYGFKRADRSALDRLVTEAGVEPLIVVEGRLSDTTFSNLVLQRGDQYLTPATPLLAGTRRARLLREHRIAEAELGPDDLADFETVHLVNALVDLGELVLPVADVRRH